jgi:uncharacterized cupredoxin-like copper-binding protein
MYSELQQERYLSKSNLTRRRGAMHHGRPALVVAIAVALLSFAPAALSHGEGGDGKPKAIDLSQAAETPFGRPGDAKRVGRTIKVGMNDRMQFVIASGRRRTDVASATPPHAMPGDITVKQGETVRFIVHNDGRVMHEMVIGSMKELKDHAELMRKFPDMEHDEPYMAHVAPGKQGEIVWHFTRAGEFYYACLIPGHMEAGMVSKITVLRSN